jgi:hypothetical protein
MAFHLARFLAQVSPRELRRHFQRRHPEVAGAVDWAGADAATRAMLQEAILQAGDRCAQIIPMLERMHCFADVLGDRAMRAVCGGDKDLLEHLHRLGSPQERALWLYDCAESLFERAEEIRFADHYAGGGRPWTGFVGPRARWPEPEADRLER